MNRDRISAKAARFTESVIREMTRLAGQHRAINLAQGFPNFAAPQWLKDRACQAVQDDINQYAITWGATSFRQAVSEKYAATYDFEIDPETEVTVACGATECMISSLLAVINPGDKVLVFEPFYENYDFYVITDEIYEHIIYDGLKHHLIAGLPGMRERTITISGLSKTFSITGWRLGYILAPPDLTRTSPS